MVNLVDRRIETFTLPENGVYVRHRDYGVDESVPFVIEGEEIDRIPVIELLP